MTKKGTLFRKSKEKKRLLGCKIIWIPLSLFDFGLYSLHKYKNIQYNIKSFCEVIHIKILRIRGVFLGSPSALELMTEWVVGHT